MKDWLLTVLFLAVVVVALFIWPVMRYVECRRHDFSVLYCIGQ